MAPTGCGLVPWSPGRAGQRVAPVACAAEGRRGAAGGGRDGGAISWSVQPGANAVPAVVLRGRRLGTTGRRRPVLRAWPHPAALAVVADALQYAFPGRVLHGRAGNDGPATGGQPLGAGARGAADGVPVHGAGYRSLAALARPLRPAAPDRPGMVRRLSGGAAGIGRVPLALSRAGPGRAAIPAAAVARVSERAGRRLHALRAGPAVGA